MKIGQIAATTLLILVAASQLPAQAVRRAQEAPEQSRQNRTYRVGKLRLMTDSNSPGSSFVLEEGLFGPWYVVIPTQELDLGPYVNRDVVLRGTFELAADGRTPVLRVDRAYAGATGGTASLLPAVPLGPTMALIDTSTPPNTSLNTPRPGDKNDHTRTSPPKKSLTSGRRAAENKVQMALAINDEDSDEEDSNSDARVIPAQAETNTLPPPRQGNSGSAEPPLELRSRLNDFFWSDQPYLQPEHESYPPGTGYCPGCRGPMGSGLHAACDSPERFWLQGEYLHWWTSALETPPLVTTSAAGTPLASAGVFGLPTTTVLFGNADLNDTDQVGWRASGGIWLGATKKWGAEVDYFQMDDQQEQFALASNGSIILARPYFDIVSGNEAAVVIAYPAVASGSVDAEAVTRLLGGGARLRWNLCCSSPGTAMPGSAVFSNSYRIDITGGYRYSKLSDRLRVMHTSVDLQTGDTTFADDLFLSGNEFHGGEVGIEWQRRWGRWWLVGIGRLALGNNHQTARIDGRSVIDTGSGPQTFTGGVLAQSSNIGLFSRDEFSIIPELGLNLGLQLTNNVRVSAGYTFYYFSNVLRAADLIDRDLNPGLIPPPSGPVTGPLRPAFAFNTTDFWAQGLTAGIDVRF